MPTSAIIVTYKSQKTLPICLASVKSAGPREVITIDNTDNNIGFAAGANKGAKKATGDYLFFLNPDTIIPENTITSIEHYFKNNPNTAIVGFTLMNQFGKPELDSHGQPVTPLTLFTRHFLGGEVGWVSGATFAIRKNIFEQLKGFDERFFMYWEDVDLCRRAKTKGYNVDVLLNIKVTHQRGASHSSQIKKTKLYDASADKYFRKYYPALIWQLHRALRRLYRLFQPYSR